MITDTKGFIRFNTDTFFKNRVERLEKMFGYGGTVANWFPSKDSDSWENYPYKNYKNPKYLEPYTTSPAEVFCNRYLSIWKKFLKTNNISWIRISYIDKSDYTRKCMTMCIYDIEYKMYQSGQAIILSGWGVDGCLVNLNIKFDELHQIAINVQSGAVSGALTELLENIKPDPIYPIFKIHQKYYSENYDKYLEDCEKYKLNPLDKSMIDMLSQDIYIDVTSGTLVGENDDNYVVNSLNS